VHTYVWARDMKALMKLMLSLEEGVYAEKVLDDDLGGVGGRTGGDHMGSQTL
jgi:hypothetical protein